MQIEIADLYNNIAVVYLHLGKIEKSIKHFELSLN